MIGVKASMPNAPEVRDREARRPASRAAASVPLAARSIRSRDRAAISPQPERRHVADHRARAAPPRYRRRCRCGCVAAGRCRSSAQRDGEQRVLLQRDRGAASRGSRCSDGTGPAPAALNWPRRLTRLVASTVRRERDRGRRLPALHHPRGDRPADRRDAESTPASRAWPPRAATSRSRMRPLRPLPRSASSRRPARARPCRRARGGDRCDRLLGEPGRRRLAVTDVVARGRCAGSRSPTARSLRPALLPVASR